MDYNVVVQCGKCRAEGVVGAMHLPEMHVMDEGRPVTWPEARSFLRCHQCVGVEVSAGVMYEPAGPLIAHLVRRKNEVDERLRHEQHLRDLRQRQTAKRLMELGATPNDMSRYRHKGKP